MSNQDKYIIQIAETIKKYRHRELCYPLDEAHVERWVSQFEHDEQEIILQETSSLLANCYFNKKAVKKFLLDVITSTDIWDNGDTIEEIKHTHFLRIQRKGSSQALLLDLLEHLLFKHFNTRLSTNQTNEPTRYLYLDDCLFSGNTLRRDLEQWIPSAQDGSKLDIVFLATYSYGEYYIANKILNNLCHSKGIQYRIWAYRQFKNFTNDWYNYDCLWPKEVDDQNVADFIVKLQEQATQNGWPIRLFREREFTSPLFTDYTSREIFEQAMLKAGAYIYSCCANPKQSMKPMGYDFFNSLGFGAFFATFNNISNNSPLAFWWGDPYADKSHPFSKWYPLIPRKVNDNDSFTW